jgi:DNA-binding GntR family transcriptional regulator
MPILKTGKPSDGSLTDRVYRRLRKDIISGAIPSGTRLWETTLAGQLEVSRTPVREALHKLALEGLLTFVPRAGFTVAEMTVHDITDLFSTRAEIELVAVKWAIRNIKSGELDLLERNLKKTRAALKNSETGSMIDLDAEFHSIIYKAARNKTLYLIADTLSDHTLKFRKACIHIPEVAQRARSGHSEIYKAIKARDPLRAEQAVRAHLDQVQEDILACLERLRRDSMFV